MSSTRIGNSTLSSLAHKPATPTRSPASRAVPKTMFAFAFDTSGHTSWAWASSMYTK